jgi:hypothetical protein
MSTNMPAHESLPTIKVPGGEAPHKTPLETI